MNKQRDLFLKKRSTFSTSEAEAAGISKMALSLYVKKGILERVSRGIYRNPAIESKLPTEHEDLVTITKSIPDGIVCLVSALEVYQMTDEIPRQMWIAVNNDRIAPRRKGVRIIRFRNTEIGKSKIKIGNTEIPIFDRERTIIDSFRYLGEEIGIKALRAYLKKTETHQPDLNKLSKYSKLLKRDLSKYVLALTT